MTALRRSGRTPSQPDLGQPDLGQPDLGRLRLGRVPMILMYHGVEDVADDPHQLCVTPGRFAGQLAVLQRLGLRGVGVGTLVDAMRAGRPRGLVGITFDDGYLNVLEAALPELKRRGFTASVYIISGRLGGTNEWDEGPAWPLLNATQVGELAAAGMEIGSHSASHVRLAGLPAGPLDTEVSGSRAELSELTGGPVRGFAYPYGSMDAAARRAVRDAGYDYACAVQTPRSDLGLMALPRVYVGQQDGAARMAAKRFGYRGYIAVKGIRA
jgi:peptidoglycan/xylan/chitin deacetylase (PgdA/CDA1 family)